MSNDTNNVLTVKCPECGKLTVYSAANPSRPFCSERCKLIDLGQWADESYKIPTKETSSTSLNTDDPSSDEEPH